MTLFEVSFRTSTPTDAQEDAVVDELDGFIATHSEVTVVTVAADGRDGCEVGDRVAKRLRSFGLEVIRVEPDLVNAAGIAERAGVSRQSATNWSRSGLGGVLFPAPIATVGTWVWRWSEVSEWLTAVGKTVDDVRYLTFEEETKLNARLIVWAKAVPSAPTWTAVFAPVFAPSSPGSTTSSLPQIYVSKSLPLLNFHHHPGARTTIGHVYEYLSRSSLELNPVRDEGDHLVQDAEILP